MLFLHVFRGVSVQVRHRKKNCFLFDISVLLPPPLSPANKQLKHGWALVKPFNQHSKYHAYLSSAGCSSGLLWNYVWIFSWWSQKLFVVTPNPGEMIQFDEHIFQMGWNINTFYMLFIICFSDTTPIVNIFIHRHIRWSHSHRPRIIPCFFCYLEQLPAPKRLPLIHSKLRKKKWEPYSHVQGYGHFDA